MIRQKPISGFQLAPEWRGFFIGQGNDIVESMDQKISDAWLAAAADLGIKVEAPFHLTDERGTVHWFEAYIEGFGCPKGTVVSNMRELRQDDIRRIQGYYCSNLSPSYETYNRKLFIDTLNDWGWHGEKGKAPSWHTGQSWS